MSGKIREPEGYSRTVISGPSRNALDADDSVETPSMRGREE